MLTSILACLLAIAPASAALGAQQRMDLDNVVVLLDASGSMEKPMIGSPTQAKMDAAKAAIRGVLEQVPASTQVGLLVFSGKNKRNDWLHPLGPRDDARMVADLAMVRPKGGTPLGAYMKIAADRLLEQRRLQNGYGTYRLLVVTDGQADEDDQPLVDRYLPDILARGMVVDVIGVSMTDDHVLATRVHSYRRADDPQSLQRALSEVFAEVSSGSGAGSAYEEGRELLAAFGEGLAMPVLTALSTPSDAPIGSASSAGVRGESRGQPEHAPLPERDRDGASSRKFVIVFGLLLFVVIMSRRRRRRNRSRVDSN
jgi:uncharacterized protein YegL